MSSRLRYGIVIFLFLILIAILAYWKLNQEVEITEVETVTPASVSFVAVGDIIAHDSINQNAYDEVSGQYNYDSMFGDVVEQIGKADIAFANQETISTNTSQISGYPSFNAPFELSDAIANAGFDIVSIANNHSVDIASSAPDETASYYQENYPEMKVSGSNSSCNDLSYQSFEVNGISFTFNSYTYGVNNESLLADCNINIIGDENYDKSIEDMTSTGDVNIVSLHFGEENIQDITEEEREIVQNLLDSGVEIILGTHPHVLKPIEKTINSEGNDAIVAYSLGNFLSTQLEDEQRVGGVLSFDIIKEDKIKIENILFTPTYQYYTWDDPTEEDLESRKNIKIIYLPEISELESEDYYIELLNMVKEVIEDEYLSYLPTEPYSDIIYLDNNNLNLETIVNKHYCLDSEYIPENLIVPNVQLSTRTSEDVHYISQVVEDDLIEMFDAASDEGINLVFTSGYRSYETQESLYGSYVATNGVEAADMFSARPGCSEHQTGIAFDIGTESTDALGVDAFNGTDAAEWIANNSYKYGFIVRYPEDKTYITQYDYESWHLRYVGRTVANEIHESNVTLEEYVHNK